MSDNTAAHDYDEYPDYETAKALSPSVLRASMIENSVVSLRQLGHSFADISTRLNITQEAAAKALKNALRKARRDTKEKAAEVVELNLLRLDSLIVNLSNRVTAGETAQVDRLLKVMDRQAKYLGLDIAARNPALTPKELGEDDRKSAEQIAMNAIHGHITDAELPDLSEEYEDDTLEDETALQTNGNPA